MASLGKTVLQATSLLTRELFGEPFDLSSRRLSLTINYLERARPDFLTPFPLGLITSPAKASNHCLL